jgi:hypothetical protein
MTVTLGRRKSPFAPRKSVNGEFFDELGQTLAGTPNRVKELAEWVSESRGGHIRLVEDSPGTLFRGAKGDIGAEPRELDRQFD